MSHFLARPPVLFLTPDFRTFALTARRLEAHWRLVWASDVERALEWASWVEFHALLVQGADPGPRFVATARSLSEAALRPVIGLLGQPRALPALDARECGVVATFGLPPPFAQLHDALVAVPPLPLSSELRNATLSYFSPAQMH
jgi:hypothetical protein